MNKDQDTRREKALEIVYEAADMALEFFRDIDALQIEAKGVQDLVSNADRSVETFIRKELSKAFPDDGIVGEEHENVPSKSGFTWIIDPIDGTASFVCGTPGWCVVLACVTEEQAVIGVVRDAIADETFLAVRNQGATLNGRQIKASSSSSLNDGVTGVGHSTRIKPLQTLRVLEQLMDEGGIFYRSSSGALMLSYVAAGRLIGYCEPHMYSWDCVAALLIIREAGGSFYPYSMPQMLAAGSCIIAGAEDIYPKLEAICRDAYGL